MTASMESAVRFGTWIAGWIGRGAVALKDLGPYAAIELVLPGGSVLALLLWLYRRHRKSASTNSASSCLACGSQRPSNLLDQHAQGRQNPWLRRI